MSPNAPAERPSLGVVLAGGFAVVVVLAFVGAVAFGGSVHSRPGDQVDVVRGPGATGLTVLAGRCVDDRVTSVALADSSGADLWRVSAAKGSIERRFVVGGEPPLGFTELTPRRAPPAGVVRAMVTFERDDRQRVDARMVDLAHLAPSAPDLGHAAPPCSHHEGPGGTAWLFAVGAAFVVAGYIGMVIRFVRGR